MKVVILAGGRGTRLAEETEWRPKPMVEIGGRPILWHIMQIYAQHGFKQFLVACGYKSEMIKRYFHSFHLHDSDFFIDLRAGKHTVVNNQVPDWEIGLIDTGLDAMTGGRILALRPWLRDEPFMVTYGDGVADVDLSALLAFHRAHGKLATVTAVRPPSRFGSLVLNNDVVERFAEKSQMGEGWINGGFFVFQPQIFDYLRDANTILEREPLEQLAAAGELNAFRHFGFWQPMDTLRDRELLESLWKSGSAAWKTW